MLKEIISPMGCNIHVDIRGVMHERLVVAPISSMPYQMIVLLGGLSVDMGWLLGALCVADSVPLVAPVFY
jgi:hypothetical protein